MDNQAAQAYAEQRQLASIYAARVVAYIDDADAPGDDTTWGHVADMAVFADALRDLAGRIGNDS